jgi:Holliday junction DNA helicase RuvA
MIGSLRGTLLNRSGSQITVEVAGVGYRLATTPATSGALGAEGAEVFVWVHHHIREDNQSLFGFAALDERDVLIAAHGVGPSLGLAILSTHSPAELRMVVATEDVAGLCRVPGVGKKTAQRLMIDLKSSLVTDDAAVIDIGRIGAATAASAHADVREALVGLGYSGDEVAAVLKLLPAEGDTSELLRTALQRLATL